MDLIVRTDRGYVRGVSTDGIAVFKGIPYAAPLTGRRRFQAPELPARWEGVRDADSFSASVPQPGTILDHSVPTVWSTQDSADCLSVNVWTPESGGGDLPVMVWIHGGLFIQGTSGQSAYDGTAYARNGVVFVSLNYRLGFEGFGWVSDAPSNRGILDQMAALRWVRDNIASFGGNPDNVTIFGQSAGANSVAALVTAPPARGLFRRGIAQSVSSLVVAEGEARAISAMITDELGIEPTTDHLAGVPPETMHDAQMSPLAVIATDPASWTNSFTPYSLIIDGEILENSPWEAMRAGSGREIDFITGYTADECRAFTVGADLSGIDPVDAAEGMRLPAAAVDAYRAVHPDISDFDLHTLMLSDSLFRMPSLWCAEGHAEAGGLTYLYEFAWPTPVHDGALGACHSLDLPFAFGVADSTIAEPLLGSPTPPSFGALSTEIITAWTSFARTGDPGWPQFRPGEALARRWNTPSEVLSLPVAASRKIWHEHTR